MRTIGAQFWNACSNRFRRRSESAAKRVRITLTHPPLAGGLFASSPAVFTISRREMVTPPGLGLSLARFQLSPCRAAPPICQHLLCCHFAMNAPDKSHSSLSHRLPSSPGESQSKKAGASPAFYFGDPRPSTSEHWQPLESIEIVVPEKADFSKEFVEKYQNGFSVGEIAAEYGCSKHKILLALKRHRVNMRPKVAFKTTEARRYGGKSASKPYYGFCYFEGKLTKHPIEFPVLQLIHRMWQQSKSAHYINLELDKRRFKSREGRQWSWAAIQNILKRFEEKKVVLHKGGRYELG